MQKVEALSIIAGLLFISVIILFCVILIRLYFTKIKTYTQQLYQKDLDFQKTLTTTVMETQEQVLNNISQDLHDDAGQQLTYINFQIENLKLDSPELKETLEPLTQSVGQLSQSVRSISHSLNNQLLMQQDVIKAIATEVERLQKNTKVTIAYVFKETVRKEFNANEKIFIYRIFQECMNNCFKHAKATAITITITTKAHFEMVITDDGKGFNQGKAVTKKSLGLTNMKTRAAGIGYQLTITSQIGHGTTIVLTENKTS